MNTNIMRMVPHLQDKHDERYKMIPNSTEENLATKLEASPVDDGNKASKAAASSSSSTPWLRLKDPRIVRVSRAFGGKDRHSKVCTIRGLRDRRVRLSVSTAIQLYDLQDRLGLNQPSKVVDWLLNVAKDEIDELPPLPIPAGSLGLNYQSMLAHNYSHGSAAQTNEFKINCNGIDWEASSCHESNRSKFGNNSKAVNKEAMDEGEENKQHRNGGLHQKQVAASNTSSTRTHSPHPSSFSALLNNVSAPFGYHWEPPSNLPSSHHMGSHGFFTSQAEDLHNFNVLPLPSPLSLSTGSQIFVCPPGLTQPLEIDPRQVNHHLQMLSSSSQSFFLNNSLAPAALHSINQPAPAMRPFHFSMAPKFVSQEKNNGDRPNKNDDQFASE